MGRTSRTRKSPAPKANPPARPASCAGTAGRRRLFAYTKFFKGGGKKEQAKPDPDAGLSG